MGRPALLTCPFCGGQPRYVFRHLFGEWFVSCSNVKICAAKVAWINGRERDGYVVARTPEEAAKRWNAEFSRQSIESPELITV